MAKTHRPKLGQHFLTSDKFRRRIVDALPLRGDDLVIEIGAGRGAMTPLLAERAARVVAVELDPRLAEHLRTEFAGREGVEILQADILQVDAAEVCRRHRVKEVFVFGNLPYYITSPILHHLVESASDIRGMAFVVQREVALRITASPGSRAYGYLSVMAQCYSTPRVAFSIPPGAFSPPPAVHSALVTFEMTALAQGRDESSRRRFLEFVKLAFAQKRRNLANNLAAAYAPARIREVLANLALGENVRAEEMRVEDLWRAYEALQFSR